MSNRTLTTYNQMGTSFIVLKDKKWINLLFLYKKNNVFLTELSYFFHFTFKLRKLKKSFVTC